MRYTRSPRAVKARTEYAELKAKQQAGIATAKEKEKIEQLHLFVDEDEDEEIL